MPPKGKGDKKKKKKASAFNATTNKELHYAYLIDIRYKDIARIKSEIERGKKESEDCQHRVNLLKQYQENMIRSAVNNAKEKRKTIEQIMEDGEKAVGEAFDEKFKMCHEHEVQIGEYEKQLNVVDKRLAEKHKYMLRWTEFRDVGQHENQQNIENLRKRLQEIQEDEDILAKELDGKLEKIRVGLISMTGETLAKSVEIIAERLMNGLTKKQWDALIDNARMLQSIHFFQNSCKNLAHEIDVLEQQILWLAQYIPTERARPLTLLKELQQWKNQQRIETQRSLITRRTSCPDVSNAGTRKVSRLSTTGLRDVESTVPPLDVQDTNLSLADEMNTNTRDAETITLPTGADPTRDPQSVKQVLREMVTGTKVYFEPLKTPPSHISKYKSDKDYLLKPVQVDIVVDMPQVDERPTARETRVQLPPILQVVPAEDTENGSSVEEKRKSSLLSLAGIPQLPSLTSVSMIGGSSHRKVLPQISDPNLPDKVLNTDVKLETMEDIFHAEGGQMTIRRVQLDDDSDDESKFLHNMMGWKKDEPTYKTPVPTYRQRCITEPLTSQTVFFCSKHPNQECLCAWGNQSTSATEETYRKPDRNKQRDA